MNQELMTQAQKAATFDLLREKRVIEVRKTERLIDGKMKKATSIVHGPTADIVVEDFVR